MDIDELIAGFSILFPSHHDFLPWEMLKDLKLILEDMVPHLVGEYLVEDGIAIHQTAIVEVGAVIKRPAVIGKNCYICANAYLREGVFLDEGVKIGPGCEIKNSMIFSETAVAHFNYIGNSLVGSHVNFEAGSIAANYYNERVDKIISVRYKSYTISTGVEKFGSLIGDHSKIGANAVLSPGTILEKNSVVKRLELVDQTGGTSG